MLPSFKVIIGPYVLQSLVSATCGFVPSSKMFPMIGNGRGPGGSFLDSEVCFSNLGINISKMLALTKVISSKSVVWYSIASIFLRGIVGRLNQSIEPRLFCHPFLKTTIVAVIITTTVAATIASINVIVVVIVAKTNFTTTCIQRHDGVEGRELRGDERGKGGFGGHEQRGEDDVDEDYQGLEEPDFGGVDNEGGFYERVQGGNKGGWEVGEAS
ncbi:hypothetical protein VNO78_15420 [Psophocarpus tetragonolobus]|uniref:Uncharacterized protein n=1 Tax=Psophocarpus tetragonolobus TaxID=3891 RepID=A0AAN9SG19_PSOTE